MISRLRKRLEPPASSPPVGRDLALEGVRGCCAALVFYAHLFLPFRVLDPVWTPSPRFSWFNLGYPAVLFFFVLSGYVIGLVTTGPATLPGVRRYLLHRAGRLLPLNTFAVLISLLLLGRAGWRTVTGNLLFLQNVEPYPILGSFPLLENNPNLWSLNYEVVFYLGFIALWFRRPKVGWLFGGLLLLISVQATGWPLTNLVARYACGSLYWLAGLTVAWMTAPPAASVHRSNWPAAGLTVYALWAFAPLHSLFLRCGWTGWIWPSLVSPGPMSPHRLDFLPVCVWLLLAVTGRAPAVRRLVTWICLSLATAGLAGRLLSAHWEGADTIAAMALVAAWMFAGRDCSLRFLRWLAPLGTVSFAIYVIAAPLQLAQRAIFPNFSGSGLTFAARWVAVVVVVAMVAWLLERRLCPPIGRWIRGLGRRDGPMSR
jgi:peptidoglycan/LPS O-acetylase OafA/YrhL